ncbi:MAG: ParB/RepB/Spo0J family partition protein [Gammaproteobacteria bacterium]|nr:ParB/RepB/Spo0J family partition protein [Gammaproteobacteria bacterium]
MSKKRGLGRGLDALLGVQSAEPPRPAPAPEPAPMPAAAAPETGDRLRTLPVDVIERGRYQPRVDMRQESLQELADSIKAQGVVQPIVVRPLTKPGRFEIIAGERRWRASQLAGMHEIPAIIKEIADESAASIALIENIMREQLNPIEEALGFDRLTNEFGMTHQDVAEAVGRSRAAVTNLLRLLDLAPGVREMVEQRQLEMGHARALLGLEGAAQLEAAREVVSRGMSVRETEQLVKRLKAAAGKPKAVRQPVDPNIVALERDLSERLGAAVTIQHGARGRGQISVTYHSLEELDGILAHIK